MVGVITGWEVLWHPAATIRCFGWRVFFRAVIPWQGRTFLGLLRDAGVLGATAQQAPEVLEHCIQLELRARRIYAALAKAFADEGLVGAFFAALADQERSHADLLELSRAAAGRGGWNAQAFAPWQDHLPRLSEQMNAADRALGEVDSVEDALRLVLQIESSEINPVFRAAIAAGNAAFVRRLRPFREVTDAHLSYIAERIPQLEPKLTAAARELRAKFPRGPESR